MANYLDNIRIFNAERFVDSVATANSDASLYITFGKNDEWPDDTSPPAVVSNTQTEYSVWNNMIGAKRITSYDIRQVIRRVDWQANTVFDQYDDQNNDLFNSNNDFFVLTSNNRIYKCLDNRNGLKSNIEPTGTNTSTTLKLSDGYTWKYMYSLSDEDRLRFTLDDYIPIRKIVNDEGSEQWDIQQNAIEGAIHSIILTNGGTGYTNVNNIYVSITGDGTGAQATATVNTTTNVVNSIVVVTEGTGYSRATVRIFGGGGANATARAVISPFKGHGSNPTYELGASNILINARLIGNQGNKYPDTTEFRQVSILKDPFKFGTETVSSNTVISQTLDLSLYNYAVGIGVPTDYDVGEEVYQGTSISNYSFKARVVAWDSTNNIVRLTQVIGTPTLTQSLYGNDTTTNKVVNAVINPELEPYSGQVLYVDNFTPITKDPDQTEDIKVLIKF